MAGEKVREEARLAKIAAEDPQKKELFDQIDNMMKTEPMVNPEAKRQDAVQQKSSGNGSSPSSDAKATEKKEL